ncbi:hypothetical protein BgiMline_015383 [Biomphalaria glabrata]|nr:hypothetical protein BgiMline_022479 [Biomphalaria glabrata]KAI8772848.1 hypothetical protein BgiBS90_026327 [Biomphalaria glabrata]
MAPSHNNNTTDMYNSETSATEMMPDTEQSSPMSGNVPTEMVPDRLNSILQGLGMYSGYQKEVLRSTKANQQKELKEK